MSVLINICIFGTLVGIIGLVLTESCNEDKRRVK